MPFFTQTPQESFIRLDLREELLHPDIMRLMKKCRTDAALVPIDFDRDRLLPLNHAAHRACSLDVRLIPCKHCLDRVPQVGALDGIFGLSVLALMAPW
ncbi:MAG: hypothetical protein P1P76_00850 [Anaerolineales bacterium]|nr:hypothetical protein [Anaerolineales bacterium]